MLYRLLVDRNFGLYNDLYYAYKEGVPNGTPDGLTEIMFDLGQIVFDLYIRDGNKFTTRKQLYDWLELKLKSHK